MSPLPLPDFPTALWYFTATRMPYPVAVLISQDLSSPTRVSLPCFHSYRTLCSTQPVEVLSPAPPAISGEIWRPSPNAALFPSAPPLCSLVAMAAVAQLDHSAYPSLFPYEPDSSSPMEFAQLPLLARHPSLWCSTSRVARFFLPWPPRRSSLLGVLLPCARLPSALCQSSLPWLADSKPWMSGPLPIARAHLGRVLPAGRAPHGAPLCSVSSFCARCRPLARGASSAPCSCSLTSPCARLLLPGFPSRAPQLAPSLFAAPSSDPACSTASPPCSSPSWWSLIGSRLGRAPTPSIAGDGCHERPFLYPILAVALCSIL
jgi:hypothetical protein